jgi:3-methyladenine DNA glycosylase AlkC
MVSISSSKKIRERTQDFCNKLKSWGSNVEKSELFEKIDNFLKEEYEIIPDKERIGKGMVFISKHVAKQLVIYLKKDIQVKKNYYLKFIENAFEYGELNDSQNMMHFALYVLSEFIMNFSDEFESSFSLIKKYADHKDWPIRESTGASLLAGLKKCPEKTLEFMKDLAKSSKENFRRLASESSRPLAEVKWLRDPSKNDKILELLTYLRKDSSIYVRKSVGNNIKDLTKYMPEKILGLMENWLKLEPKLKVHDQLATEVGLSQDQKRLIWTMKHALRWIKARNPEYHDRLEKILGKSYVIYFDEKKNRLAKPK